MTHSVFYVTLDAPLCRLATADTSFARDRNGTLKTESGTPYPDSCSCGIVVWRLTRCSVRALRAVSNSCESACSGPALALHLWPTLFSRGDLRLDCATSWHSQKMCNYRSAAVEVDDDCCHEDFYDQRRSFLSSALPGGAQC